MLNPRILLGFLCITTPNYNLEWSIKVTPENTTPQMGKLSEFCWTKLKNIIPLIICNLNAWLLMYLKMQVFCI
jgi:hypothetical protein